MASTKPSLVKHGYTVSNFGRMDTLFKLLLQVQDNHKKMYVVTKLVKLMFGSNTHPSCGKPAVEENDTDSSSDKEDMIEAANEDADKDLNAKEINAIVAVTIVICTLPTIVSDITYDYVRKQLYADKQESIPPESALVFYAKIVNILRKMSVKLGEEASFSNSLPMRQVRNTLVRFSDKSFYLISFAP